MLELADCIVAAAAITRLPERLLEVLKQTLDLLVLEIEGKKELRASAISNAQHKKRVGDR